MKSNLKLTIGAIAPISVGFVALVFFIGNEQDDTEVTPEHQQMIHEQGMGVMPFGLDETQHIFKKTVTGGTQSIVVRDASDAGNSSLIRMHLQMEAKNFSQGNFSDPSGLHGESMPGLSVLEANASKMKIAYSEIENGAKIDFEATNIQTVNAIHDWFDAQVKDHGNDALTE